MLFVSFSLTVSFIIRLFSTSAFRVPMRIICLVNNNQEYFTFMGKIVACLVFPSFSKNLLLCRTNHYVFEAQRKLPRSSEQRIRSGVTSRACAASYSFINSVCIATLYQDQLRSFDSTKICLFF